MTRPKGYAEWNPKPGVLVVLDQVREIIAEYRGYGPMTVRQIFYRLVGEYGFEKTEKAYKRLCEYMVRARRARVVPFYAIRDDGTESAGGGGWEGISDFWEAMRYDADHYTLDHQQDQPQEIEVWCEAAGMVPMLARMVSDWDIPVHSTGGFSSVTVTHETADRIVRQDRPTVMLHIGDYDPSGESIFTSMAQDIGAFVADDTGEEWHEDTGEVPGIFEPVRVALTREQVARFRLPTAPPKASDSRSRSWRGSTTQAEAMPPDLLRDVIREAVGEYIDPDALTATLRAEAQDKAEIRRVLAETYPE